MRRSCSVCGSNDQRPRVKMHKADPPRRPSPILAHQRCLPKREKVWGQDARLTIQDEV